MKTSISRSVKPETGRMICRHAGVLCAMAVLFMIPKTVWAQAVADEGALPVNVAMRLSDHLSVAESAIVRMGGASDIEGKWNGAAIVFEDLSPAFFVEKKTYRIDTKKQTGIYFCPLINKTRRLRFYQVPPGSKLRISYGIPDPALTRPSEATLYLRVYAGKYEIRRILISPEKGWKTQVIDLGVVPFLKKNFILTIDLTIDLNDRLYLLWDAEILR